MPNSSGHSKDAEVSRRRRPHRSCSELMMSWAARGSSSRKGRAFVSATARALAEIVPET